MATNLKIFLFILIIVGIALGVFFTTKKPVGQELAEQDTHLTEPLLESSQSDQEPQQNPPSTIAAEWQWQALNDESNNLRSDTSPSLPFTPQSVHDALQAVKVDVDGNVVLDHEALISLDEALERIYKQLDSESLVGLQDIIKSALPGKVGEQTAELVGDYHGYLAAKEDFSQMYEGEGYAEPSLTSLAGDQALYAELQELRALHLGKDASGSLFKVSDANAEFMFESMKLELDTSLTPEQKAQRLEQIQSRLLSATETELE